MSIVSFVSWGLSTAIFALTGNDDFCSCQRTSGQKCPPKMVILSFLGYLGEMSRIPKVFGPAYALFCHGQCFEFSSHNLQCLTRFDSFITSYHKDESWRDSTSRSFILADPARTRWKHDTPLIGPFKDETALLVPLVEIPKYLQTKSVVQPRVGMQVLRVTRTLAFAINLPFAKLLPFAAIF